MRGQCGLNCQAAFKMVAMAKPIAANGPVAECQVLAGKGLKPKVGF